MKSISLLASLAAVSAICVSVSCSSKSDSGGSAGSGGSSTTGGTSHGGTSAEAGETANGGTGAGKPTGGSANAEGGDTGATGGDTGTTGGDTGTGGGATSCSTATLFSGDPLYDMTFDYANLKPAGQGLLDDAPLRLRTMVFVGKRLFVETQMEIWTADLSLAKPIISRFAGNEPVTNTVNDRIEAGVACKDTQFIIIDGIAAKPDGTLVVADSRGGAVVELTDPGLATCQSHYVAGTHAKFLESDIDPAPAANAGDTVGKGVNALFTGVMKPTVDTDGNIYVWDEGNSKIKKIATDADRTVSTIATLADDINALLWFNGKLYTSGNDGASDFIQVVDPTKATGNVKDVFREQGHFSEITNALAVITSLTTDGEALIGGGKGYIWRIDPTDGTVIQTLAGSGAAIEFPAGYDPLKPHPAADLVLENDGAGFQWLTYNAGALYWAGGVGVGTYAEKISCP